MTVVRAHRWRELLLLLLTGFSLGCGSGLVPVSGTVNLDGQPVGYGSILLQSASGSEAEMHQALLEIRNGQFDGTNVRGLPPGNYNVRVTVYQGAPPAESPPAIEGGESSGTGTEPVVVGQWEGTATVEPGTPIPIAIDKASLKPIETKKFDA